MIVAAITLHAGGCADAPPNGGDTIVSLLDCIGLPVIKRTGSVKGIARMVWRAMAG